MILRSALSVIILAWLGCEQLEGQRRPVPEFEINLDAKPEDRFTGVVTHFNTSIQAFFGHYFSHDLPLRWLVEELAKKRGPEDPELMAEVNGIAAAAGVPAADIHAVQMLYELQTFMLEIDNVTWPHVPHVPWSGPGCTGILATNKEDGKVYHARNLDFSPKKFLQDMTYTGKFMRGGKELFRSQMVACYQACVTALKPGPNGFSIETNTRFATKSGADTELYHNLFKERRPLNGWVMRKVLETAADYDEAVKALTTAKLSATQYTIIGGVKKGTILARDPDQVVHQMTLGQPNFDCRDDYIIVTNFDYFWHDLKEWFDPTARGGHKNPRRVAAQKLLNSSASLTPEVLFSVINDHDVFATDTMFQVIMSPETGMWNASLPQLATEETESARPAVEKTLRKFAEWLRLEKDTTSLVV